MSRSAESESSARERRALRLSAVIAVAMTVVALVWGLWARSQVMLLDAVFTPLGLVSTWGALAVSKVVAKGPTRRFPFGRDALIPLFVIAQALVMAGALLYAIVEAVRVILSGGSDVSGLTLLAYGVVGAVVCAVAWLVLRRISRGEGLVDAEAAGWLSAAASSVVVVVGGVVVLLVDGTRAAWLAPYADSALVVLSSLALTAVPVGLVRRSVRELQVAEPDAEVTERITAAIAAVREAEGLPEPILRSGVQGHTLDLELAFVLPPGDGDVACEDRVRRVVAAELADLPLALWLSVEFTHDADLVA